jgi:hypothetical protein
MHIGVNIGADKKISLGLCRAAARVIVNSKSHKNHEKSYNMLKERREIWQNHEKIFQ